MTIKKTAERVMLVFPAAQSRRPVSLDRNFPPMGITKLATRLKKELPGVETILIDEAYQKLPEMKSGDVVGITCTTLNSARTAEIAREANAAGARVVVGGPHASHTAHFALREVPEINQVVMAHGEEAFPKIVGGGLTDPIIRGTLASRTLPEPLPDLSLWGSLAVYEEVFQKGEWAKEYADAIFLETQRGCTQSPRCSYCVRGPAGIRRIAREEFWPIVEEIWGARLGGIPSKSVPARSAPRDGKLLIFDFSDEFLAMGKQRISHLRELAELRPEWLDGKVEFLAYARPDQIDTPEVAMLMRRVGVTKISLGIESGDPDMLVRMNRKMTLDDHRRAVRLLSEAGISIYPNLLLGGLDETTESMRRTVEHFKELVGIAQGAVYRAGARFVVPFPGSLDFIRLNERLIESGKDWLASKAAHYATSFVFDPAELERDYVEHCTFITMQEGIDAHAEMLDFARSQGIGMSDKPFLS
jgi:anaerobic magnesium-protoporphyrin IX monomethyl ester cyclase